MEIIRENEDGLGKFLPFRHGCILGPNGLGATMLQGEVSIAPGVQVAVRLTYLASRGASKHPQMQSLG